MSKKYYDKVLSGSGTSSAKVKSAFGSKILAKYGWKEGQGLGATMSGVSECVQIERRDERVGIGAERKEGDSEWDNWWSGAYDSVAAKINVKISKSVNTKNRVDDSSSSSEDDVVTATKKKKKTRKERSEDDDDVNSSLKKRRIKRHVRQEPPSES
jgi:hypothetical protein